MEKLVLRHTYHEGSAWDVSKNNNHGQKIDVTTQYYDNRLVFTKNTSKILVRSSESLREIGSIKIQAQFFADPSSFLIFGNLPDDESEHTRFYLAEADKCFELFFTLSGIIWANVWDDSANKWIGLHSSPNVIQPNLVYAVEFVYDGISHATINVTNQEGVQRAAEKYNLAGAVTDIGNNGIVIGNNLNPTPTKREFRGTLLEFAIWKRDEKSITGILDPCCIRNIDWDKLVEDLEEKGYDEKKLSEFAKSIFDVGFEVIRKSRQGSPSGVIEQENVSREYIQAIMSHDTTRIHDALDQVSQWAKTRLDESTIKEFHEKLEKILKDSPFSEKQIDELMSQTCLDEIVNAFKKYEPKKYDDKKNNPKYNNQKNSNQEEKKS